MSTEALPSQPSSPIHQSSLTSRLTNVFVSPGDVYAEVKASPVCHANWWVPGLVLVLASWCAAALMFSQPSIKQQIIEIQEKTLQGRFQPQIDSGKMTQAQVDQIKAQSARFAGIGQWVGGIGGPLIQAAITPFWGGLILWAGAMWIFKRPFEFLKGVEVVGLAMMVMAVGALIKGLLCTAMGTLYATPGPGLLVRDFEPTNPAHNMLMALDVFGIWVLALRAVGLAKLSDISLAKAAAWVFGVWIVFTVGMLTFSWAVQKLVGRLTGLD